MISRRKLLAGTVGLSGCGPKLAKRINGYALVANRGSHSIAAVNLTRFRAEKHIALAGAPTSVLAHAGRRKALVLLPDVGTVVEVDAGSLAVSQSRRVADQVISMRLADGEKRLWLLCNSPHALVSLDLNSWKRDRLIPLAYPVQDFDISPDGESAVVSYSGQKQCAFVDLRQGRVTQEIRLDTEPGVVRFRPDGKEVLIGSELGRTITVAERGSAKSLVTLPLPFGPKTFCFSLDNGGQMFATGPGMDAVAIVYPYQTEVAETVLAGREPGAMAINDTLLFVTNPPTGDTTVMAIAERQVIARISSGEEPCAVILTPDGEYALVLNRKSGDMAVVRLSKLTDLRYKRAPIFDVIAVGEEPVSAAVVML